MIGPEPAFALFALTGVACVYLAARQDGPALAVLGLSGAFLAPVLAGGRAESPLPLFSYFALLNVFILAVDWFKSWRVLNIAGFVFTLAVGMTWAVEGYHARHYPVTQSFVILFLAVYSAMPVVTALLRAPGLSGWRDGMLLFGVPLVGAFLQTQLMAGVPYGLAWSALIGSLWYFALWALLARRPEPGIPPHRTEPSRDRDCPPHRFGSPCLRHAGDLGLLGGGRFGGPLVRRSPAPRTRPGHRPADAGRGR